jgi:hypothetical protein
MIDINKFLSGYIGAALWSTTDSRDEEGNDTYNLDDEFDSVSDECKAAMLSDCTDFVESNKEVLEEFKTEAGPWRDDWRLGYLFWLNRSGHGSGFWDECANGTRGGELGELLSDASKPYGDFPLFGDFEMGCVRSHHYG